MTALELAIAEMENVAIKQAKYRIERARATLHSNHLPADETDKVAGYTYAALQRVSLATITNETRKLNELLDR
jgi:hypothetical protein